VYGINSPVDWVTIET